MQKQKLNNVDEKLIEILEILSNTWDICVICGYRNQEEQDAAYYSKKSLLMYPNSKHNSSPSHAVDIAPLNYYKKIEWDNIPAFKKMAEDFLDIAEELGYNIDWGGYWKSLKDYVHFELKQE